MPQNPQVKGGAIPYIQVDGALKAADFYTKAFGAEVVGSYPPDDKGRTMHVHLYINGGSVMLSDPFPEQGYGSVKPAGYSIMMNVDDIDARYRRAVEAGCTAQMPPADMFWGDRYGQLVDPYGVSWAMNQPGKG